jgi:asparagine N-glycosylation enzyme membrane subunit Stt3
MRVERTRQTVNLAFAWSGALLGLVSELNHRSFLGANSPRSFEVFVILALIIGLLWILNKTEARGLLTLGLCVLMGLLCTRITFLLVS